MGIYLPEKVVFTKTAMLISISLLKVDKSLCLLTLKSIIVLLDNFSTMNENVLVLTFSLKPCSCLSSCIKIF